MSDATLDLLQDPDRFGARAGWWASPGGRGSRPTTWPSCARDGIARRWVLVRPVAGRAAQWLVGARDHRVRGPEPACATGPSCGRSRSRGRSSPAGWLLSALVVWSMYALLIVAWRVMLAGWGQRLDGWTAARIWTVSSLGKYLPGKVWAVAGHGAHGAAGGDRRRGPRPARRSCCRCWPSAPARRWPGSPGGARIEAADPRMGAGLLLLIAGAVAGVALLLWPPFLRRLLRLAAPGRRGTRHAAGGWASSSASRPTWSPGWATASRSGCSLAGCCRRSGLDPGARDRGVHGLVSGGLPGAVRARAASACARDCLFSCCRARWASRAATALARRVAGAAHDHRARRRRAVSRLLAAESACRTLSPRRPSRSSRRRPALLAGAVVPRSPRSTVCWPMLTGQWLLGDDQYVGGLRLPPVRGRDVPARPGGFRNGIPISSAACRSSRPSTATSSIRRRGSAGSCRSTRR